MVVLDITTSPFKLADNLSKIDAIVSDYFY